MKDFSTLTESEFLVELERHNELSESNKLTINDRKKFTDKLTPRQRKIYSDNIRKKWNAAMDSIIDVMKRGNYENLS